jgi:2,4-dienoyl-CoA reductase-like NADH-dependent reductase (Old Yellow Enzyme family)
MFVVLYAHDSLPNYNHALTTLKSNQIQPHPTYVALRLSPTNPADSLSGHDSDPDALFSYAISNLDKYNLAYLLLTEPRWKIGADDNDDGLFHPQKFRSLYTGPIIGSGGFTPINARQAIENKEYDAVAFGRWFIANPDLPERLRTGAPLNKYNRKTFYSYEEAGYLDYPTFEQVPVDQDSRQYELVEQSIIGQSLEQIKPRL